MAVVIVVTYGGRGVGGTDSASSSPSSIKTSIADRAAFGEIPLMACPNIVWVSESPSRRSYTDQRAATFAFAFTSVETQSAIQLYGAVRSIQRSSILEEMAHLKQPQLETERVFQVFELSQQDSGMKWLT